MEDLVFSLVANHFGRANYAWAELRCQLGLPSTSWNRKSATVVDVRNTSETEQRSVIEVVSMGFVAFRDLGGPSERKKPHVYHCSRSASTGSTFIARRAGKYDAATITITNTLRAVAKVEMDITIWGSSCRNRRAIAKLVRAPIKIPMPPSEATSIKINFSTLVLCAPSAIRIPISRARRITR